MAYTINLGPKKKPKKSPPPKTHEEILQDRVDWARRELGRAIWDLRLYKKNPKKWARWKTRQMLGSSRLQQLLWKIRLPKSKP